MQNRFKNKKISILGDSLSTFEGTMPSGFPSHYYWQMYGQTGLGSWKDTWWGQVIRYFDATLLVNNSWSGSFVCSAQSFGAESWGCGDERTSGLHDGEDMPDHIIVCMGANDRGRWIYMKMFNEDYCTMLDKIKINYPNAEIWCCTLPNLLGFEGAPHKFLREYKGARAEEYNETIINAAKERGIHILDVWDENDSLETHDGLHPNFVGMTKMANMIISQMENDNSF